ncbi:MAG: 2Fe-2S iron-sulfur cluster-binding protein, partial [Dokdonella sp.]
MRSIDDIDYGTPAFQSLDSLKLVQLDIDGVAVNVPVGTSIMRAAAMNAIAIPRLCATDTLDAFGSCRLCLV